MPAYQGLSRCGPDHLVSSVVRREIWEPSLREKEDNRTDPTGEWACFFPTLDVVKKYWALYAARGYNFDCIEVHLCDDAEDATRAAALNGFLGFDVSCGTGDSALEPERVWSEDLPVAGYSDVLSALLNLCARFSETRSTRTAFLAIISTR